MEKVNPKTQTRQSVNFRPLFYGCLAFAVGIGFAHYIFSLSLTHIILCVMGFLCFLGVVIFKKKFVNFIVILACFAAGLGAAAVDNNNFSSQKFMGQELVVEGRVGTKIYPSEKTTYLILENVTYQGEAGSNLAIYAVTAGSDFEFETGMKIQFTTQIYDEFLYENQSFNTFAYKMSAAHSASIDASDITVLSVGNLTFAENVRLYVKNLLHSFMPYQTAELSYSILFGDQTQLDETIKTNFATSGLGHLVAVSGLNTAVLVACIYWLLKAFRTPKLWRFIITAVILIFYCYLCSFSPSVVRASVMSLVFLGFTLLGRQYDLLSSLGVAGFIILIVSPLSVYDAGFLMSFLSVIAIGILAQPLSKFFTNKCKVPNKLSAALAIDICTTLAISPVLAMYFGKISFFSWLTNLICVPLFSAAYIIVFALVIIVSVLPFLGFLFAVPNLIFQFIIWFSGIIASITFAIINLYSLSLIGVVAFFLVLFFISSIYMAKTSKRLIASSISICLACVMTLGLYAPNIPTKTTYTQLNSYSPCAVLTSGGGEVLAVCDGSINPLEEYLKSKNIYSVTTLVCSSLKNNFNEFITKYNVKNVVSGGTNFVEVGDFGIKFFSQNQINKAVYIKIENFGALIALDRIGSVQAQTLKTLLEPLKVDVLYETKNSQNFTLIQNFDYVFSRDKIYSQNNFATKINGAFTFEITNGIIGEIRSAN